MPIAIRERHLEDILVKRPDYIEPGLIFMQRQVSLYNRKRIDLYFKDKNGNDLFVELKRRGFKNNDIKQILNYYRALKYAQDSNVRLLVVATGFCPEARHILRYLGVELKRLHLPSDLKDLHSRTKILTTW